LIDAPFMKQVAGFASKELQILQFRT